MENPFHHSDPALMLIGQALASIAHSVSIAVSRMEDLSPEEKAAVQKVTNDLKSSHDRLIAAINAAQPAVKS